MASNESLTFQIVAQYETLNALQAALAKATIELKKVAIGSGEVSAAFQQQQAVVDGLKTAISNYSNLASVQSKEMEKVWASLDKLNKTGAQSQQVELKKTQAIQQNIIAMQNLSKVQTGTLNPAIGAMHKTSANAGMALLNLNYVIRDSPYFFNNFAMGVLAVGNNINPLIDSFSRVRAEAKLLTKNTGELTSTFGLLKKAMVGGAGISVAFSLLVTVIQAYVFSQARANRATKETTKSMAEQRSELQKLTREQLLNSLAVEEAMLRLQEVERGQIERPFEGVGGLTPQTFTQKGYTDRIKAADELIKKSKDRIKLLKSSLFTLGDIENIENRIAFNEQRRKDLNQDNVRLYKDVAGTYDKIASTLDQWIASDKALLKIDKERTKELKGQADHLRDQAQAIQAIIAMAQGRPSGTRPAGAPMSPYGMRGSSPAFVGDTGAEGKHMKESMREFNIALETGKIFANQLGDALNEAFMKGTVSLERFIKALILAIAQMLILRAITAFLTGGAGNAASAVIPTPAGIPKAGGLNKGSVRVTGEITADKNNFIAKIRNADSYFAKNEEFILIGR